MSNPATLREVVGWMKQQSKRTDIGPSRREAFELCWRKVELSASGTEAAPVCNLCHHSLVDNNHGFDQNDASMDGDKLIHSGCCTYCKLCQAQPAQAAASPEGEWREAFERWVLATHEQTQPFGLVERSGDGYLDGTTQKEWKGWQAALRQSAAPSGGAALVSKLRDLPVHKIGASRSSWDDVEPTEYVRLSDLNALLA